MSSWTDEQRRLLVECAYHATEITGHSLGEIAVELSNIVSWYRDSKVDDKGRTVAKGADQQAQPATAVR